MVVGGRGALGRIGSVAYGPSFVAMFFAAPAGVAA